jgi:hypothetical protein
MAQRLDLPELESLDPQLATSKWGVAKAHYSLGSNSRVRSVRARMDLGWAPHHASVVEWVLKEMPIEPNSFQNQRRGIYVA